MNATTGAIRSWSADAVRGWDQFWFTPAAPHTLCLIRVFAGAMIFYTHLVWTLGLTDFLGPNSWISRETASELSQNAYIWSPFFLSDSPYFLWALHLITLIATGMLTVGLFTRPAAVVSWVMTLAYCHRLGGSLFGLDQVNAMLAMYLMLGPCGAVYSVDRWLAKRKGSPEPGPSVGANIAIRLMQLHLCVIYLFGGIGKMRGEMWWDGMAVWFAVANLEYQSLDLTWLARMPILIAALTHITVFWETFYCVLVWPRWTRPVALGLAVAVHGGIAIGLGMITFGLAMIIANMSFLPPSFVRDFLARIGRVGRAGQGGVGAAEASAPPMTKKRSSKRR